MLATLLTHARQVIKFSIISDWVGWYVGAQRCYQKYDDKVIFEDISLKINKGEIVSILGPSGCGKTTLLHIILGLTDINEGRLAYNGEDITRVPMKKRGFNIVFQDYALFPNLNVKKYRVRSA